MARKTSKAPRNGARLTLLAAAIGVALSLCGCIGYEGDFDRGYQIDEDSFAKVKIGSTDKREALALMGTPSTTSTVGGDAWYYVSQKMSRSVQFLNPTITDQHVLALYFDKSGRVSRVANYGLKDGEVFDFVSRTTPTGGEEPNFLHNMFANIFRFG